MTVVEYSKLKVDELKKLLSERDLSLAGKKADFVARLLEHDKEDVRKAGKEQTVDETAVSSRSITSNQDPKPIAQHATSGVTKSDDEGMTHSTSDTSEREAKLAARARRFGLSKNEEEEKKKQRAARFGQSASASFVVPEDRPLSQPKVRIQSGPELVSRQSKPKPKPVNEKRKTSVLDDPVEAEKARKRAEKYSSQHTGNETAKA